LLDELSSRLERVADGASLLLLTSIIFDGGEKGRVEERGKSKKKIMINGFKKKR
jgi:hypothetical protein